MISKASLKKLNRLIKVIRNNNKVLLLFKLININDAKRIVSLYTYFLTETLIKQLKLIIVKDIGHV